MSPIIFRCERVFKIPPILYRWEEGIYDVPNRPSIDQRMRLHVETSDNGAEHSSISSILCRMVRGFNHYTEDSIVFQILCQQNKKCGYFYKPLTKELRTRPYHQSSVQWLEYFIMFPLLCRWEGGFDHVPNHLSMGQNIGIYPNPLSIGHGTGPGPKSSVNRAGDAAIRRNPPTMELRTRPYHQSSVEWSEYSIMPPILCPWVRRFDRVPNALSMRQHSIKSPIIFRWDRVLEDSPNPLSMGRRNRPCPQSSVNRPKNVAICRNL